MEPEVVNNSWANRRRAVVLGSIVFGLSAVSFLIFWNFFHKAPSCFDNIKNGDEMGIDCGGSCVSICGSDIIKPIVRWDPRMFEVTPGLWSMLVYIENPNPNIDATYVPYTFTIIGENNEILMEKKGATILPKNKTVGVFESGITIAEGKIPKRAVFELGDKISWNKNEDIKDNITITHGSILQLETAPRVEANVKNNGEEEIKNIELIVAVFDGSDNAVAASRTFIEKLKKNENSNVVFTWPHPFSLGKKFCETPSRVVLLLDRSGSMSSLGVNPPEPLSTAKAAATSFIERLNLKDKIGVISFANEAKDQIGVPLVSDFSLALQAVESINIEASSTQYTNIYDALRVARQGIASTGDEDKSLKIIILLTDGVANNPRDPKGKTEADDIKYAESLAKEEANNAKREGISIYTIGLGDKINESFLKMIASSDDNYFFAPSASNLESIYKNISSSICEEIPSRIEITYKIFGNAI